MERHGCMWFVLLICLSSSLGATLQTSSFQDCNTDCPTEDCKEQIVLCLKKISDEETSIRNKIHSSTEIKELVKSMKKSVTKIYDSSRDMIRKMRDKGEDSLKDEEKAEKFKSEANLKEIKGVARDILFTKDIANKVEMFKLLIPLNEKVDNEIDRLSQLTASTSSGTVPAPAVPADGECDKCSPNCLQDILTTVQTQFTDMLQGEELFKKLEGVVETLEDKKINLEKKKSKAGIDPITRKCYQRHIDTLKELYGESEKIYVEMRDSDERSSLTLADNHKLASLAREVTDLLGRPPTTPGCVLGKLEATIKEMKEFQKRLEGENAEKPRVNSRIGDDLYDSIAKIATDKKAAADGDCEESWGKFFQEKLRRATFDVAESSKTGNIRKYQISQTNLEKAIAKHIKLLQKLKSVEEKKTSSGDANDVKTKDVDANECNQKEYNQAKTYIDKLVTLELQLDAFAKKKDETAVKTDSKTATDGLKDIIFDLDTRESSLRRNSGNQCQEETKHIEEYRTALDKCKDAFKSPSKRDDFTELKTCIDEVEDEIKGRRNDLTSSEIKNKLG